MKIFISHISEEAPLAVVLKDWIESTFGGRVTVFVSSDLRDIPAGSKWLEEIDSALEGSASMVLLCSPVSISRPWVNFEAGCGWIKRIPIIPVCHSGQKRNALPVPISTFQALELEADRFVSDLLKSLGAHLNIPKVPRIDENAMRNELRGALSGVITAALSESVIDNAGESIDETAIRIVKAVADLGDEGYRAEDLAPRFKLTVPKMQYHLDILVDAKLLFRHIYMGAPSRYTLTKAGRRFLVEKSLL